ncbi:hypothetical protein Hdeb2414_s0022g00610971 [Helianthus debilis subsp. tardiflorus]
MFYKLKSHHAKLGLANSTMGPADESTYCNLIKKVGGFLSLRGSLLFLLVLSRIIKCKTEYQ